MSSDFPIRPFDVDRLLSSEEVREALPYPGLRPFKSSEQRFFFGRTKQVAELIEILAREISTDRAQSDLNITPKGGHFVTVIGPSGCGKSSLLRAGVIPDLQFGLIPRAGQLWSSAKMRPGSAPIAHLRDALLEVTGTPPTKTLSDLERAALKINLHRGRAGLDTWLRERPLSLGQRLLLLVDQFEELFRYDVPPDEARDFVDLLVGLYHEPLPQVYVILTMRTDYLGDCTRYQGLPEVVNGTFYLIPPLDRNELEEAITKPAREVGGEVERALAERLIRDMGRLTREPGEGEDVLPLVQHALMWMWIRARGQGTEGPIRLTLRDYESDQVEDISKALSHHANQVLEEIGRLKQDGTRHVEILFRQLVQRDKSRYIRRPAKVGDIVDSTRPAAELPPTLTLADVGLLVDRLARDDCGFLSVQTEGYAGGDTRILEEKSSVDIGHEALIRQWDRLKEWSREEADAGERFSELTQRAMRPAVDQRLLDEFEQVYFNQVWTRIRRLYIPGGGSRSRFPSAPWAMRYLDAGRSEESPERQVLYERTKEFWERSEKSLRQARLQKQIKWAAAVVGTIVAVVVGLSIYYSLLATQAVKGNVAKIGADIETIVNRGRDYGRYRDGPAYRRLAEEAAGIAASCEGIEPAWWMGIDMDRVHYYHDVAQGLQRIYQDVAGLHGIPGQYWPGGGEDREQARRLPETQQGVFLVDTLYFEHGEAQCIGMINIAGELFVACAGSGPWQSIELDSQETKARRECLVNHSCSPEWREAKIARLGYQKGTRSLVAVSPWGSVHRCTLPGSGHDRMRCESLQSASRWLTRQGERLRSIALDPGGGHLAALTWTVEDDRPRQSGYFLEPIQGKGGSIDVTILDLTREVAGVPPSIALDTQVCRLTEDVSDSRLRLSKANSLEASLWATFDSDVLCQWRFPARGEVATRDGQGLRPNYFLKYPQQSSDLSMALSDGGARAVLFGVGRPLTMVNCRPLEAGEDRNPCAGVSRLLSVDPIRSAAFVDPDRLVASFLGTSRNEIYLARFWHPETLKLDTPKDLPVPVTTLITDPNEERVFGLATSPNGSAPRYVVQWNLSPSGSTGPDSWIRRALSPSATASWAI